MNNKLLLVKAITLLYRESFLPDSESNSSDLVNNLINTIKISDVSIGLNTEKDTITALRDTAKGMAANPASYQYHKTTLEQQLRINCKEDDRTFDTIKRVFDEEYNESNNKRAITNLIKDLTNYFIEDQISSILSKNAYEFKLNRDKIKDINAFVSDLIGQLEPLQINMKLKDPALIDELDLSDSDTLSNLLSDAKNSGEESYVMKTGWQDLNTMLQGGIRRGECGVIGALQHKYKTGFTMSLFKQLAIYNKPYMIDPAKKPLMLRISFEDDLKDNMFFLYQQLKTDESDIPVDMSNYDISEATKYITDRLGVNGYHVKFMRVDPTKWTYRNICNKVTELEAQGYEIHVLMLDYLAHVPTTGCINSGPMGTDIRDMFRRMRNFCSPKKIALITPHQLSTESKNLLRTGIPEETFVKEINEKGYYAGTKQLDQEVDWEIYIHIAKSNRKSYLTVQRGKHRLPSIIPDEEKYFILKFPKKTPIPDDLNREKMSTRKIEDSAIPNDGDESNSF